MAAGVQEALIAILGEEKLDQMTQNGFIAAIFTDCHSREGGESIGYAQSERMPACAG